ncbi:Protein SABRE [Ophidiomyces ophidiicola]|nr:Protein SABRE [Ophidiomyces ophidiicola]KAI1922841.1 Protein SABRE [Ophidiomyces ophidiicola]KAI2026123.1 Protein SABRE [Ophidiomyces ophidiicola]KAI2136205.1 Protein SABRE [Ophidiomyces ophidiicola]KAI2152377.1 Protein SABRE [Ophidiomyces ophidiicola]
MALSLGPTSVFVTILLIYISTFIFFAIVRIATGVSIQRIGYFSLRRIAYSPKEGVQIGIRGLGLSLHWPTFAQPTYVSLLINELSVTLDPKALHDKKVPEPVPGNEGSNFTSSDASPGANHASKLSHTGRPGATRTKTWKTLTRVKEAIKRLHRRIHLLSLVDVTTTDTILKVIKAGEVHIGGLTAAVDTRQNVMERGRLFRHKKDPSGDQRPAEWVFNIRNVLLALEGREPEEIVDNIGLNIHGLLHKDVEGLRDVSVSVKVGKLHVPYDDLLLFASRVSAPHASLSRPGSKSTNVGFSCPDIVEEVDETCTQEDGLLQTVAESREFLGSLLRGIQEIQVALSFFRFSRVVQGLPQVKGQQYLNIVTHEVGIDFHRMDPNEPAHRMYFRKDDIAHQALVAAISSSISLDDNTNDHDKIMYIPMATATIKTTLPSKTVSAPETHDAAERNTNVLFANFVVTSPSIDLEPGKLAQLICLFQRRNTAYKSRRSGKHVLISQLLPKASIKLSIHEPVLRFVLPLPLETEQQDYNLLVSSISSISLDIESSHSAEEGVQYSLASVYRVASHMLYYQTALGVKHHLLSTESLEVKAHLSATTEFCVVASGNLNTFSVHLVSGEVTHGVHQVVEQFNGHVQPTKLQTPMDRNRPRFLRRLPPWLLQFQFEILSLAIEIAGTDDTVQPATRGIVLQLGGCSANYEAHKAEPNKGITRRRTPSHSAISEDPTFRFTSSSPSRKSYIGPADGRRLAIHVRGLEGFVMESADYMETESFLSIPRFEVALSTTSDLQGPIFHINSIVHEIFLRHSLYRYYAIGVAFMVVQDAFFDKAAKKAPSEDSENDDLESHHILNQLKTELVTIDFKAPSIEVKLAMPMDPNMMIQIYGLAAGRHRWSPPFVRVHLLRLHAEAPKLKGVWARIVSIKNMRVGFRESRSKQSDSIIDAKGYDISTDSIRLGVPHHMVMHRVFDNFINTTKAIQQLNHRFKTRTNEYVLEKQPEGPRRIPKISLRSKVLLFELEDDAFEWKLSTIYRLGVLEQRQRLTRDEAYRMKTKKVQECQQRRAFSRLRAHSAYPSSQKSPALSRNSSETQRSKSADRRHRSRSISRGRRGTRKVRYDPQAIPSFTEACKVAPNDSWLRLQQHNAHCWRSRIDSSIRFQNTAINEIRSLFAGADELPEGLQDDESILAIPNRPGLLAVTISDVHLVLDKPSFPINSYAEYINRIGKGMPMDMKYSLLIPMSIQLDMGEARANLRDYPLDLLHIPALRPGQPTRIPCWSIRGDFVIAEEFRNKESSRQVMVKIVPPTVTPDGASHPGFSIDVRRTVSPVKTYSDPKIEINTSLPTSISWGMSYQPVIQDMMKIIEGFSKPEIDLSDRVGFWDKIRLSFHSRINVMWKGDGDVHLRLKGSRDPYVVTGFGAGFVMCWRKDVQWEIHTTDDPKEFMSVTSGEYVLAIPDYSHQARHSHASLTSDKEASSSKSSLRYEPLFKKVIMKLSGNVRWLAGLVFERAVHGTHDRSFDFRPHYEVVLRNPKYLDSETRKDYDAYRGFRSHHIHLSVAVVAPVSRVWSVTNREPSASYNTVHLTPRFFTHFFNWWSLFSGVMSLPVRQGPLWPGLTKTSKKFSRHLGTVKYNLFLSPLFVSHIYKHKDAEDYNEDTVFATGIKSRLDSFMLDLHQRREQVKTQVTGRLKQTKASMMRINRAQFDFISADFRAVSASIDGTKAEDIEQTDDDIISTAQQPVAPADISRFNIPDHDLNWVDMDDFVELDWVLPAESNPKTQILPLAYSPRFSYFRQTDHEEVGPDETGYSRFGDEPTHYCVMPENDDPRTVQLDLIQERLRTLDAQIRSNTRLVGEHELQMVREGTVDDSSQNQYELLVKQGESLQTRRTFLQKGLRSLEKQLSSTNNSTGDSSSDRSATTSTKDTDDITAQMLYASPDGKASDSEFNNRFIIHNIQLKWNNSLRNIVLRYIHQNSQRRGFVYYMSRRAVKFILDIVEEQGKSKFRPMDSRRPSSARAFDPDKDDELTVEARIEQLLSDAKRFVNAEEPTAPQVQPVQPEKQDSISPEFTAQNSYYVRLIAPQIQLQSEKNKKSVALVTAKGMQLKIVSIRDKTRESDDVSGLVQRRFTLDMDSAQFFVATQKTFSNHAHIYCGNRYGNSPGAAWPPWVSLESMFDFDRDPLGLSRIIQKTSASLRYDKYNALRLKYNEKVASGEDERLCDTIANENRIDQISVDFPQIRAICDSSQYYSMYVIVLDLLLYSEPLEQVRSERLEKIMLASDFSDLRGAPEMVSKLQQRIKHLEDIKNVFQIQSRYLDTQGWKDRMAVEKDLAICEDELFFIMKAITTSQRKKEELVKHHSSGLLRWTLSASEIVWHLMREHGEPLVEFQLRNAAYERTDNVDGSNHNAIEINRIYGLNLLSSAIYPQMIVPYLDEQRQNPQTEEDMMLRVNWYMLGEIGGIPVLDDFQVSLFPLKVQLERELGQKLFEYIFPGVGSNAFENGSFSPFMIKTIDTPEDGEDGDETGDALMPDASPGSTSVDDLQTAYPEAIEMRLTPTLTLQDNHRSKSPALKSKILFAHIQKDLTKDKPGTPAESTRSPALGPPSSRLPVKKSSVDSLRLLGRSQADKLTTQQTAIENSDKHKKFALAKAKTKAAGKGEALTDDISQMMSRASNYMILSHVKINDVVLCLSYKGKDERNIEDVHDFVFRLPVLDYSNKTWSNLDLALRLKKDAIKALISHAPAILGNKFSQNRPNKQQQKRLRELASSKQVFASDSISNISPSDGSNSIISRSSTEISDSPRRSFQSNASPFSGAMSMVSGLHSNASSATRPHDTHSVSTFNIEHGESHHSLGSELTHHRTGNEHHVEDASKKQPKPRPRRTSFGHLRRRFLG